MGKSANKIQKNIAYDIFSFQNISLFCKKLEMLKMQKKNRNKNFTSQGCQ